jgi:SAM-dependent methyltransferase
MNPALNIWEKSRGLLDLIYARGLDRAPEMDCAAQGAELLAPLIGSNRPRLLDAGCAGGHFYHSLARRGLKVDYYGLDSSPQTVALAQAAFRTLGLEPRRLVLGALADLAGWKFELAAVINTLSFNPDFREPLDRILDCGVRALVIRDNFGPQTVIRWEPDGYLDEGHNHLRGYWNQWSLAETREFLASRGFQSQAVEDRRVRGQVEMVVGKPYRWSWLVAVRE